MLVQLDRDSVAAGDDVESHDELRAIDGRRPLELVVRELISASYLPRIAGGRACWVVRTARRGEPIAVAGTRDGRLASFQLRSRRYQEVEAAGGSLFFEYRAQEEAGEVCSELFR